MAKTIVKAIKHNVQDGESIDSIAKKNGLTWNELAKFNWGTDNPNKINKFLFDIVGCRKKTKDKKNYIFTSNDVIYGTGYIWIPKKFPEKSYSSSAIHTITVNPSTPAKIISVEFLDGPDGGIVKDTADQFVNLPAQDKWVDGTIVKNKDRLSEKPRIKVVFDQPGSHRFFIKLVPDGNNAVYTTNEKGRNGRFNYSENEKGYRTGSDGTLTLNGNVFITVAGNDTYSLAARDKNGVVLDSTGKIKTIRFFYIIEIEMNGIKDISSTPACEIPSSDLNIFLDEFKTSFIKIEKLNPVNIDHIENIDLDNNHDYTLFLEKVNDAFKVSEGVQKVPYCVAVVYTDHLAEKISNVEIIEDSAWGGPGYDPIEIIITDPGSGNTLPLWQKIVDSEDWFISCKYIEDGTHRIHDIGKAYAIPSSDFNSDSVTISINHLPDSTGKIILKVNCVGAMTAGFSVPNSVITAVSKRCWWQPTEDRDQNQVMIHEVGHHVGMVPHGEGTDPGILLDELAFYYEEEADAPSHVGPHCHCGIQKADKPYDGPGKIDISECVMYGATNGITKFCPNVCKPATRKLDISNGWQI